MLLPRMFAGKIVKRESRRLRGLAPLTSFTTMRNIRKKFAFTPDVTEGLAPQDEILAPPSPTFPPAKERVFDVPPVYEGLPYALFVEDKPCTVLQEVREDGTIKNTFHADAPEGTAFDPFATLLSLPLPSNMCGDCSLLLEECRMHSHLTPFGFAAKILGTRGLGDACTCASKIGKILWSVGEDMHP